MAEEFGAPELQKQRVEAATKVMGIFDRHFRGPQGSHIGTVLSAAAWLTGTSLYRSFGFEPQVEPGTVVLSDKANEEGPKLLNLFLFFMYQNGLVIKPDQFILEIPDGYKPLKTITEVQEAHQEEYNAIMLSHGLDYVDGARSGIVVCSMLVDIHCVDKKDMDARLAAGMISMGIVAGTKTAPPPLKLVA
jgi:hypothetical protein